MIPQIVLLPSISYRKNIQEVIFSNKRNQLRLVSPNQSGVLNIFPYGKELYSFVLCHDVQMNFADNWARVIVVITFLAFGEAQIIGGIVPNLIAFSLFLGSIRYFASTGRMAEMFGLRNNYSIKVSSHYRNIFDTNSNAEHPSEFQFMNL